jgi:hypothetical protein
LLEEERDAGCDVRPWQHKGFSGWTTGHVDLGARWDCCIVRLHSHVAQESWWDVFQESTNTSRLDLQVTARFPAMDPAKVVGQCWRRVRRCKAFGKGQQWHHHCDSSKGDSLELGRRVSERFGRIYDKQRESGLDHYDKCVRFELEAKGRCALRYVNALHGQTASYDAIRGLVRSYFQDRGLELELEATCSDLVGGWRQPADIDRWLRWAAIGVRPRVQRAIACGKLDMLLDVLGLRDVIGPLGPSIPNGPMDQFRSEDDDECS